MRYAVSIIALLAIAAQAHAGNRDAGASAAAVINARAAELKRDPASAGCLGKDAATCLATLSLAVPAGIAPQLAAGFRLPATPDVAQALR